MAIRTSVEPLVFKSSLGLLFTMWSSFMDTLREEEVVAGIYNKLMQGYWNEDGELRIKNEATGKACTSTEYLNYLNRIPKPQNTERINKDKYTGFTISKDEIVLPWELVDYTLATTTIQCHRMLSMYLHDEKLKSIATKNFVRKNNNKNGGAKIKGVTDNEFGLLTGLSVEGPQLDFTDKYTIASLQPGLHDGLSIENTVNTLRKVVADSIKKEVLEGTVKEVVEEGLKSEADKKLEESLSRDNAYMYSLGQFLLTRKLNISKIDYYADNIDNLISLYAVIRQICPEYYAQIAYELAVINKCITKFSDLIPEKYITEEMITNLDFGLDGFCSGPLMNMYIYESGDPQAEEFKRSNIDASTVGLYHNYRAIDINAKNNLDKCKITNTDAICRVIQERLFITTGIYYHNDQIVKHLLDYEFYIIEQCLGNDIPGIVIRRGDCAFTNNILEHISRSNEKLDDYRTYVRKFNEVIKDNNIYEPYKQNELYHLDGIPKPGGFLDTINRGLFARMCFTEIHKREVMLGRYLTQEEINEIEFNIVDLCENNKSVWLFEPTNVKYLITVQHYLLLDTMRERLLSTSYEDFLETCKQLREDTSNEKEEENTESQKNTREENNLVDAQVLIDTYENQLDVYKKQNKELQATLEKYKATLEDFVSANEEYEIAYNELAKELQQLQADKQTSLQFGNNKLQEQYKELEQDNQNLQDLVDYLTNELYGDDYCNLIVSEDNLDEIDRLYQDALEFFKPYKLVIVGAVEGWDDMFQGLTYRKVHDSKSGKLHRGDFPVGDLLLINAKFIHHGTLWKFQKECVKDKKCTAITAVTNAKVFLIECANQFKNKNIDNLVNV